MSIPAPLNRSYAEMGRRQRRGSAWLKRNREMKRKISPSRDVVLRRLHLRPLCPNGRKIEVSSIRRQVNTCSHRGPGFIALAQEIIIYLQEAAISIPGAANSCPGNHRYFSKSAPS
jgi:hypothetical protein